MPGRGRCSRQLPVQGVRWPGCADRGRGLRPPSPGRRWSSLWNLEELKLERRQIPCSLFQQLFS